MVETSFSSRFFFKICEISAKIKNWLNTSLFSYLKIEIEGIMVIDKEFMNLNVIYKVLAHPAVACSKLAIETLEQDVKHISHLVLVFLLLTLSK